MPTTKRNEEPTNETDVPETSGKKNRYNLVAVFLMVVVALLYITDGFGLVSERANAPTNTARSSATSTLEVAGPVMPASRPVSLSAPAIDLTAEFSEPLGLQANGEIAVPDDYTSLGWYRFGPTPGELGPAVVLGHVDSFEGPAIFWDLDELSIGDEVSITRADDSIATFRVTRTADYSQSAFPTQEVYGDIDHAGLRLITCSGSYQQDEERYTHNLVVYGTLVSTSTSERL